MRGLKDKCVIVTGGASGIGRATAERLAEAGVALALFDRNAELLAEVRSSLERGGARCTSASLDVADAEAMRNAIDAAADKLGGLYGVVTSAGVFDPGDLRPLADVEPESFTRVLAINLTGTFLAVKYALPHMLAGGGGAVVTIASTAGLRGHGFGSGYTASKGGVVALTRLIAFQYGEHGVRANCICPGFTATPMTGGVENDPDFARRITRAVPLRRIAKPEEMAGVACHLLSDDASYVNGQVIAVDGGATVV